MAIFVQRPPNTQEKVRKTPKDNAMSHVSPFKACEHEQKPKAWGQRADVRFDYVVRIENILEIILF